MKKAKKEDIIKKLAELEIECIKSIEGRMICYTVRKIEFSASEILGKNSDELFKMIKNQFPYVN